MTEVNNISGNIDLSTDGDSGGGFFGSPGDIAGNTPGVKTAMSGYDTVTNIWQGIPEDPDAADIMLHCADVATDAAGFVAECGMEAASAVLDPAGWLVGNGLDFLLSVITPLQDALNMVTGDSARLDDAADDFTAIAEGLVEYAGEFRTVADEALQDWNGEAASSAKNALADFSAGIEGVATSAGGVVEILRLSSMIMEVIEAVIKAIITEIVSWLIALWVPALAAAVPTAGASTAAAGAATAPKAASTVSNVTSKLGKLGQVLDKIFAFFQRFGSSMVKLGQRLGVKPATLSEKAKTLSKIDGVGGKLGKIATEAAKAGAGELGKQTFGIDPTKPVSDGAGAAKAINDHYGTLTDGAQDLKEAHDAGNIGSGDSAEETERQLRM
ncbi:hypothetical protein BJF85_23065 [Saccharomonospora sp. CUA-673]|uniref:WXG100 family type VII secretion target n=1 Tax=Saccharomonospora sp. CUA-673 TaxID=1904969 RepID=UPI0009591C59|nr:hypothetical protein [Saccharomonospora sp. CUA-673]OLT42417.1 hypothetical protein BJF85_23065 [Saccharomonospora sp. CUA-673]